LRPLGGPVPGRLDHQQLRLRRDHADRRVDYVLEHYEHKTHLDHDHHEANGVVYVDDNYVHYDSEHNYFEHDNYVHHDSEHNYFEHDNYPCHDFEHNYFEHNYFEHNYFEYDDYVHCGSEHNYFEHNDPEHSDFDESSSLSDHDSYVDCEQHNDSSDRRYFGFYYLGGGIDDIRARLARAGRDDLNWRGRRQHNHYRLSSP